MATSPKSKIRRRTKLTAVLCSGAVVITGFAMTSHADDVIVLLPPTTTTMPATTTSTALPTTVPETTAAPTTLLPTTLAPTTVAPTTVAPPVESTTTQIPVTVPPPTKKPVTKPTTKVNPRATGAPSIEVDISRQTLYFRRGGTLVRTLAVSTGSGRRFCNQGKCQTARTPRGRFRVQRRINGWRTSSLGRLYNPLYFSGGYAIHGSGSVPRRPASHGCVRITMSAANWLPKNAPNGTPIWIHE